MSNIINSSNNDETSKTIISLNPAYSEEENIQYELSGRVPIIGIAKTGSGILTPDKLQLVIDNMEAGTGKIENRQMDKRSELLGYTQQEFDFIHDPEIGLMKDPSKTNTAVDISNIKIDNSNNIKVNDVIDEDDEEDDAVEYEDKVASDIKTSNELSDKDKQLLLAEYGISRGEYIKEDDKYIYYKSRRGFIRRRRKNRLSRAHRTDNLEEFVLQLSERLDVLNNILVEQTNYLTKLNTEIANIKDSIG